ncbi:hypothetical protein [Lysobacter gummosus]|uniref:DUF4131 domain-containing protein n=1 Tax=Lysobacter gummosus TaxID=262324 RepID=A0ABY3XFZ8_9GAMM|nr:hypothetical protein [Lysobacter gummosus]ALN89983.1 hypothetical protein LG3211_1006 [Lysobacter gummosus]UNP30569.1 hypothetical protein MOV92_04675 [Lysobacter gummosus]
MSGDAPKSYSIDLSKPAVWKLIAVILTATAAVVAVALWLPSIAGPQAAIPQPSVAWRACSFGVVVVLAAIGYGATSGPRLRAWRIPAAVLAVALLLVTWRTLGLSVTRYNAHWGQASSVVGVASDLQQRQRRGRGGVVTITLRFTVMPENGRETAPLRVETRQPLASVLADRPRVRIDLRRSWAGVSFDVLRPCVQAGSDCDAMAAGR